jgi:hypothetical protein
MSNSEVDDIGRETSRAARAAGKAVTTFLTRTQSRYPGKPISKWSDLSMAERRQMKGAVSRALRDERRREQTEAAELRTQLTDDIHTHHTRVWQGYRPREGEQMSDWFERQQELERQLYELEMQVGMADLSDTERGQAVTAVRRAHYLPMYKTPQEIFVPTSGTRALWERMQAGLSRLRVGRARDGERYQLQSWENTQQRKARPAFRAGEREVGLEQERRRQRVVADQQGLTRDYREDYTRQHAEFETLSNVSVDREYTPQQIFAVQDLRSAELHRQAEKQSGVSTDPDHRAWRAVVDRAAQAGLGREQITWELDNIEANSRCETNITYFPPGKPWTNGYQLRGHHADEDEAARWARLTMNRYDWNPATQFEITANERGQYSEFFSVTGGYLRVNADVRQWAQQAAEHQREAENGHSEQQNPGTPSQKRETATSTENEQVNEPNEQHPRGASDDVHINGRTVITENIGGIGNTGNTGGRPRNGSGGRRTPPRATGTRATASQVFSSVVSAGQVQSQVGVQINGDGQVTAGNIGGVGNHSRPPLLNHAREAQDRARQQAEQARLQKQIDDLTKERDQFRDERDEAVTKLVQSTPPEQRYGSPQRRATENQRQDENTTSRTSTPASETESEPPPDIHEVEEPAEELTEEEN